jgi:hypothetical protein
MIFLTECREINEFRVFSCINDATGFAEKSNVFTVYIYEIYTGYPIDFKNLGNPLQIIRPFV